MAARTSPMTLKARAAIIRERKRRERKALEPEKAKYHEFSCTDSERFLLEKSRRKYMARAIEAGKLDASALAVRASLVPLSRR